ncbi:MAG: hypothetical protein D4R67_10510 [Bacteroidetes bacterium]|nr:MAG: hypothetical protein D4R67_10510 [Bacteroidota bacterium]
MFEKTISFRILQLIPDVIPGIEQAVLVHYQQDKNDFSGYLLKAEEAGYRTERIRTEAGNSFFLEFIASPQYYRWFSREQIPFEIKSSSKVQLTIFNEFKNRVLLIKIWDQASGTSDLFFFYLNENLSNFLLDKVTEPFSAQHKNMVGYLIYHSIKALFQVLQHYDHLTETFHDQLRAVVKERDHLHEQLEHTSNQERQDVLKLAQYHLHRITGELQLKASFTDSARIKLRNFNGELYQLEEVIRKAIEFAGAISSPSGTTQLLLADYHISYPEPNQHIVAEEVQDGLPQRLVKTHLLLDRLEHAAASIKQRRVPLTSASVGKEFPTPISAPAITDALRKHKKRIVQLFDQYPDKWEIIRHEFRPVQNLMNSLQDQEQLSA